ncbi:MAG TPA: Trp biosynthesis-associated membrane protein [Nocardioidaceae bacterium]
MAETPVRAGRPRPPRDRTYLPTVLLGLAGAGLAAVAGAREWATTEGDAEGLRVEASVSGAESQPLVAALSLVALAAWGVVLVVRGRVRRAVAVVGLLASAGALLAVVLGFGAVQDDSLEAAVARGATGDTFATSLTAWYYLAGVGALLATVAFAFAVARAPGWPAMGSRYDAPAARTGQETDEDMWRALDEGRDPTS